MRQIMMCTRCHKRPAVIFTGRFENGKPVNEGFCLQCAKELGIPTFAVSNYVSQSRRFGLERLRKLLTTLLDMDVSTKTGLMDAKEACSLLILQYANLQNG